MTRLADRWRSYWFRPAPLLDLAVLRILCVGFQLYWLIASDQLALLCAASARPDADWDPLPVLRLLMLPFGPGVRPTIGALLGVRGVTLAAGAFSLAGLATSPSLAVFAAGNLFLQAYLYSYGQYKHPEALMLIALAILAASPCGSVLSVDARLRNGPRSADESSTFARWPLLLLGWMQVLLYASAAVSKVVKSGLAWMNGYTLQYYAFYFGIQLDTRFGIWLSEHHRLSIVLSAITWLFEATFFLVMTRPRSRWIYLPLGSVIHLLIWLTLGAGFPQLVVLYAVFVPWSALVRGRAVATAPSPS